MNPQYLNLFGAIVFLLLGNACSTTHESSTTANEQNRSRPPAISIDSLQNGMHAQQFLPALGEPDSVEKIERQGMVFEIWRYRRSFSQYAGTAATGLQAVLYIDPITGQEREELIPVTQNVTANLVQMTELLLHKNILIEWKQSLQHMGSTYQ